MPCVNSAKQNLLDLVIKRHLTLRHVSLAVKRNPAYLQQFIRRGTPKILPLDVAVSLANYFSVDIGRFLDLKTNSVLTWLTSDEFDFLLKFRKLSNKQKSHIKKLIDSMTEK